MIVVDTNVIATLFLGGEKTDMARAVFRKDSVWTAPILWRSELRNVLALYLRKGLLSLAGALELIGEAETLMADAEYQVDSGRVLGLVEGSSCSAYDCEFVALAEDLGVPLVTADRKILADFPAIAASLEAFAAAG